MYFYHINEKHLSNQGAEITNLFLFFKLIAKCVRHSTNSPATDPMIHNKKKNALQYVLGIPVAVGFLELEVTGVQCML